MQRILSKDLAGHEHSTVTISGWVHRRRMLKSVAFLIVRDAAGFAQVVITDPEVDGYTGTRTT
ncbi:OB-fold nucleic acid binding domain-containing protein [Actinoplanes sp. TFC3]|uniref:OB-fold nucleic acid binding domain-containing protein n=1 Tax=Actinoplanes sp. TFC3 TaxID=1710355 RepID=UPI0008313244